jgi:hypothetical protein
MLGISFSTATQWQEFAGQEFGGYVGRVAALKDVVTMSGAVR